MAYPSVSCFTPSKIGPWLPGAKRKPASPTNFLTIILSSRNTTPSRTLLLPIPSPRLVSPLPGCWLQACAPLGLAVSVRPPRSSAALLRPACARPSAAHTEPRPLNTHIDFCQPTACVPVKPLPDAAVTATPTGLEPSSTTRSIVLVPVPAPTPCCGPNLAHAKNRLTTAASHHTSPTGHEQQ